MSGRFVVQPATIPPGSFNVGPSDRPNLFNVPTLGRALDLVSHLLDLDSKAAPLPARSPFAGQPNAAWSGKR